MNLKMINFVIVGIVSVMLIVSCGDKKNDPAKTTAISSVITFAVGDVRVETVGVAEKTVKTGDRLSEKDLIKTGKGSFATIQFGDDAVVRVQENSVVSIETINKEQKVLGITQGQLLSKVTKLSTADSFKVKTPTAVAAVRGTEFSISYISNKSVISVGQGKVAVVSGKNPDLSNASVVDPGFTASTKEAGSDIAAVDVRKSTKLEEIEIQQVSSVPIIADADKKNAADLNKAFEPVIENDKKIEKEIKPLLNEQKQKAIINKQSGSIAEIKEAFNRLDEITLYNKRVITGIIVSRGSQYQIVTPDGKVSVPEKDVKNVRIIR